MDEQPLNSDFGMQGARLKARALRHRLCAALLAYALSVGARALADPVWQEGPGSSTGCRASVARYIDDLQTNSAERDQSLDCLKKLASPNGQSGPQAAEALAIYYLPFGGHESLKEAAKYAVMAENRPDIDTRLLYLLGRCYESDLCELKPSPTLALDHFRRGSERGCGPCTFRVAMRVVQSQGGQAAGRAFVLMSRAAAEGSPQAMFNLGVMYGRGDGVQQSSTAARNWYLRAAEHRSAAGAYSLGLMLYSGEGGEAEPVFGAALLELAAAGGYPSAAEWMSGHRNFVEVNRSAMASRSREWVERHGAPDLASPADW